MAIISGKILKYNNFKFKNLKKDDYFRTMELDFILVTSDNGKIGCQGLHSPFPEGTVVELNGEIEDGLFFFHTIDEIKFAKKGSETLLNYLLGAKTSIRVAEAFGGSYEKALNTFINHEDNFFRIATAIKGVGTTKITAAYTKYYGDSNVEGIIKKYERFGLTPDDAVTILRAWHYRAIYNIDHDPYSLATLDISFDVTDRIAQQLYGIAADDPQRIKACIIHILNDTLSQGVTCCESQKLITRAIITLQVSASSITDCLYAMADENILTRITVNGKDYLALASVSAIEKDSAAKVVAHLQPQTPPEGLSELLVAFESQEGITFADEQKEAIEGVLTNKLSIITGSAGTGKTMIIKAILHVYRLWRHNARIALAAPTGKAAKRIEESTGETKTYTLHRLLKYDPKTDDFKYNAQHPLNLDLLIIDEFSMVDMFIFNSLLKALPSTVQIIMIGDEHQLPSVGPGDILHCLTAFRRIPVFRLKKVFRQKGDNEILELAELIKDGNPDTLRARISEFSNQVSFLVPDDPKSWSAQQLADFFIEKYSGNKDTVLLSCTNKGDFGTRSVNAIISAEVNDGKPSIRYGSRIFRVGDRVMQILNDYNMNVFNGLTGYITHICSGDDTGSDVITVKFDNGDSQEYERSDFKNIIQAFTVTIHKSQGSEYQSVILNLTDKSPMADRKLLYTAVTRAKDHLYVLSDADYFCKAVSRCTHPDDEIKTLTAYYLSRS